MTNTSFGRQASINVNKDEGTAQECRCSLERNLVPGCFTRSLVGKQVPVEFLATDIDRGRMCLSRDHLSLWWKEQAAWSCGFQGSAGLTGLMQSYL